MTASTNNRSGPMLELTVGQIQRDANIRDVQDDSALKELAESIKEFGILEPVLVAPPAARGEKYLLVAGYRRVRAAQLAGETRIPAVVVDRNETHRRQVQLIENVQREDLSPIAEARALQQLCENGQTQKEVAAAIGKSQPYVANRIRLLGLPEDGQKLIAEGKLTLNIAEQILKLPEKAVAERNRLVREVRERVQRDGEVSPQQFRWSVQGAQRTYQEKERKRRAVEAAKFPTCPAKGCGKKGRPPGQYEYNYSKLFTCAAGHRWTPATGKLAPKEPERASGSGYRAPPPPTLPEVDTSVATELEPVQIARRLLDSVKGIRFVQLEWEEKTVGRLTLEVDLPAARGAKVPDFEFGERGRGIYLSGDDYQHNDERRKAAAQHRADLEAWLATFGRSKKAAPEPAAPPTEVPA